MPTVRECQLYIWGLHLYGAFCISRTIFASANGSRIKKLNVRNLKIRDKFKKKLDLRVDVVQQATQISNIGNIPRRYYKNHETA